MASITIAPNGVFSSTSNQPDATIIYISTIVIVTLTPSPTPSSATDIIVAPTLPRQSVDPTSVFPASFDTTSTAKIAPSSSPGFTSPSVYKPASDFVIGISVGGTVFLCASVLINLILIRKRRNRIVRENEEMHQREVQVQPQPQLPMIGLDTKPTVSELESPREVRPYELPSAVPVVGSSELP
ncbi:hypothetical protein PMIN06_006215 [Paraphaeosphaeria minitans]|uniref:Uncharacterized protein n=1 Tax=Paraphaeosphaeria minitans TaxID=565426 RepID=A0A9P6GTY5_9PLEO|nr:hypothetical protein PMIN01_01336 [Paraphaeosphaeria minitans]